MNISIEIQDLLYKTVPANSAALEVLHKSINSVH